MSAEILADTVPNPNMARHRMYQMQIAFGRWDDVHQVDVSFYLAPDAPTPQVQEAVGVVGNFAHNGEPACTAKVFAMVIQQYPWADIGGQ